MTLDKWGSFLNAMRSAGEEILVRLDAINSELLCQLSPEYRAFLNHNSELILKLDKALYGGVQSARLWYNTFREFLENQGFINNPKDVCVFNRQEESGNQSTVCFHVDDVMITCADLEMLDKFEMMTVEKFENVTVVRGKKHSYLVRLFI
jgi:hypothetical protein